MPVTHAQAGPAAPGVRPGGPFQFEARDASVKALAELRALVRGIHPPVLADRGLADAIRALALDAPARISLASELDGRPPAPVESAAYFAVSELLANVSKHAEARQTWIVIRHADGMLRIGVTDNGHGAPIRAGARGCAASSGGWPRSTACSRSAARPAGGTAMDPEVIARLLARNTGDGALAALSPREREVLALMAEGRSNCHPGEAAQAPAPPSSRAAPPRAGDILHGCRNHVAGTAWLWHPCSYYAGGRAASRGRSRHGSVPGAHGHQE